MPIRDFTLTLVAAILIGIFLIPTLISTGNLNNIPQPYLILFGVLPVLAIVGMYVVHQIAKKIAILWQLSKFGLVGVLNTSIDFGILNLLILLTNYTAGAGIGIINIPSFMAAILNSYFWNKKWVFEKSKKSNFYQFVAITFIGLLVNTGIVYSLTTIVQPQFGLSPVIWVNVAKVFATGFSMVWNFTGYRLIVFKK